MFFFVFPEYLQQPSTCLGEIPSDLVTSKLPTWWPFTRKTHPTLYVSMMLLLKDPWPTLQLQCYSQWSWLFVFVVIHFQFGGVWYDNDEISKKLHNVQSVLPPFAPFIPESSEFPQHWLFRATAPFVGGPCCPDWRAQGRRGEWDFPILSRKLMIFEKPQNNWVA